MGARLSAGVTRWEPFRVSRCGERQSWVGAAGRLPAAHAVAPEGKVTSGAAGDATDESPAAAGRHAVPRSLERNEGVDATGRGVTAAAGRTAIGQCHGGARCSSAIAGDLVRIIVNE